MDNITRDLLDSGTLKQYIEELSVTGLTSNPTIFEHALKGSEAYDDAIAQGIKSGRKGEELFFDLALEDLTRAADLFRPVYERTNGVDGFVSLEVSLFGNVTKATLKSAKELLPAPTGPPAHQDSRDQGGPARHRGGHLRRHSGERDPAVFSRAIPRGR